MTTTRTNPPAGADPEPLEAIRARVAHLAGILELLSFTRLDDEQRRTMEVVREDARAVLGMLDALRARR